MNVSVADNRYAVCLNNKKHNSENRCCVFMYIAELRLLADVSEDTAVNIKNVTVNCI